jgi:hypothetical protein
MSKNSKGGRPPKPARLRRTRRLQLLLTPAEHKDLIEYAAKRNVPASELIRECVRPLLEKAAAKGGKA